VVATAAGLTGVTAGACGVRITTACEFAGRVTRSFTLTCVLTGSNAEQRPVQLNTNAEMKKTALFTKTPLQQAASGS